jgi:hypothetical protein
MQKLFAVTGVVVVCVLLVGFCVTGLGDRVERRAEAASADKDIAQTLVGGFWRTDHTFESTLVIRNVLENDWLRVSPSLYASDGTTFKLPVTIIQPSGLASIDIRAALNLAPAEVSRHFSLFGSAAITFQSAIPGAATAMIQNRDAKRSLNFNSEFRAQSTMRHSSGLNTVEGVWWKNDEGVKGTLALVNTSDHMLRARVRLLSEFGAFEGERTIELQHKETQVLNLLEGVSATSGGVQVSYEGLDSDVSLEGALENPHEGYSATMPFIESSGRSSFSTFTQSAVGIMMGQPDPGMKFPANTSFGVYLALRNVSDRAMSVRPTVFFMQGAKVQTKPLRALILGAGQTRFWAPLDFSKELGLPNFNGVINLTFSYDGAASDLLVANGSVDETKTYVLESKVKPVGISQAKDLKRWDVSDGNDTMISVLNLQETDQDLVVTLYFDKGHYKYPIHLAAGGSTMFNVSEVKESGKPDADGNEFPVDANRGTAILSGKTGYVELINAAVGVGIFNVSTATCGGECPTCLGMTAYRVQAVKGSVAVGHTAQFSAQGLLQTGTWQDITTLSTWSSSNNNIAKPGSTRGSFTGVAAGNFSAEAMANTLDANPDCGPTGSPCPFTPRQASASGSIFNPVPTKLTIVGTDSTTTEGACTTTAGNAGCGVTRTFKYQVGDQAGDPIAKGGMAIGDVICTSGTNGLNLAGYVTTCGGTTGSCSGTPGPCGQVTDPNGQFSETLKICAPACKPNGVCGAAGSTVATQTWTIAGTQLLADVKTLTYKCNAILVNGK